MTPDEDLTSGRKAEDLGRRRRQSRATILAVILGALVVLVFLVSITRIRQGMPEGARAVTDTGPSGTRSGGPPR